MKSPAFELKELEDISKSIKLGKSRDPDNLVRDIFKEGVIRQTRKISMLLMFNKIKEQHCYQNA